MGSIRPIGLELADGHKRAWVARQAGLDTVAVRVLDLDDEAAATAYARAHGLDLDDLSAVPEVATAPPGVVVPPSGRARSPPNVPTHLHGPGACAARAGLSQW